MPTINDNGIIKKISVQEYNDYLAKMRESLNLDANGQLKHYTVNDLGKIWINEEEFTGIGYEGLLTTNTKTYVEEPKRANDGSIPNINDYDTFVVPRCKVNFKYFTIDDYIRLCNATISNEFYVKYYDKRFNQFVTHKMYCEPEEMTKLYNVGYDVFGVRDYEISFIGTLNNLKEYTVTFNSNGGEVAGNIEEFSSEKTYKKGDRVFLKDTTTPDDTSKYRYYEAIWFENTFANKSLDDPTYWKEHNTSYFGVGGVDHEFGDIVYDNLDTATRKYYLAIYSGEPFKRPLSDTNYWQPITVSTYRADKTYKQGDFAVDSSGRQVYEAIYYADTFSGIDPTITTHWQSLPINTQGTKVKWGNSIVIPPIESLFDPPMDKSYSNIWTTDAEGKGFKYRPNQSISVFSDMTLYAQWE